MTVYLSLGSNLGKREKFLQQAVDELAKVMKVRQISPVYETEPWGEENQPKFLNACMETETELTPDNLLDVTKQIEQKVGRTESYRWGPREIDIDVLLYGDQTVNSSELVIPHPRMNERVFVLKPLTDLAPDLKIPKAKISLREMLSQLKQDGVYQTDIKLH